MRDKIARGEGDFSHDHNSYRSPVMPMCLLVLALFLLSAMVNRSMILDANCSLHLVFRLLKFIYRMQHKKKSHCYQQEITCYHYQSEEGNGGRWWPRFDGRAPLPERDPCLYCVTSRGKNKAQDIVDDRLMRPAQSHADSHARMATRDDHDQRKLITRK
jgi:hypothetical protein